MTNQEIVAAQADQPHPDNYACKDRLSFEEIGSGVTLLRNGKPQCSMPMDAAHRTVEYWREQGWLRNPQNYRAEGADAYRSGCALEDNPYKLKCEARDEWHSGWIDEYYESRPHDLSNTYHDLEA